jgi:hypothetical protein
MFKEKIEKLLEENMTEKAFSLWKGIDQMLPDIWEKPTSSTGKYHKKMNGEIPNNAEHVYCMLFAAVKLCRMFGFELHTGDADALLFSVVLHDALKYGKLGTRKYTDKEHDKAVADMVCENKETFLKILTEDQFNMMEEGLRFHSGRWSTDVQNMNEFTFENLKPTSLCVHMLDMMNTADLIQTDVRD